jgi:hypothetical protein
MCPDSIQGRPLEKSNATYWLDKTMCNGALVGFKKDTEGYDKILLPWVLCSKNRDCIAPDGPGQASHRGNHRQDQAGLTMLAHLNGMPCEDRELDAGFKLHQDNRWQNLSFCEEMKLAEHSAVLPSPSQLQLQPQPLLQSDKAGTSENEDAPPSIPTLDEATILTEKCLSHSRPLDFRKEMKSGTRRPHFTHVINPFPTDDIHFHWSVPAITAARKYAMERGIEIEHLAISFDTEKVDLPDYWTKLPILDHRRAAGQYLQEQIGIQFGPDEIPLKGPIVADVWNELHKRSHSSLIIWTNFDLIVREDFYTQLHDMMMNPTEALGGQYKSLEGLSILRADVLIARDTHPTLEHFSVNDFFKHNNTQKQAGHDTFVFPRHWVPCLDMRHMAFGVGGWDHAIYSQFKQLAHFDEMQFRTLDTSAIKPMDGMVVPPPPPAGDPKTGYGRFVRNMAKPGHGLVRHLGSQVADVKKYWTNPVAWKGLSRAIQYAANRRVKYEIEVFLASARGLKNMCKRRYLESCPATLEMPITNALASDGRIIGLAVATPGRAKHAIAIAEALTGMRAGSAHEPDLSIDRRDSVGALVTHDMNIWPGPKGPDVFNPIGQSPKKKGPVEFRGVLIFLEDAVDSISSWYFMEHKENNGRWEGTSIEDLKRTLRRYVDRFNAFWKYWITEYKTAVIYLDVVNLLDPTDSKLLSTELMMFEEFVQLHRCGRYGSREYRACQGGNAKDRPYTGRICCAITVIQSLHSGCTAESEGECQSRSSGQCTAPDSTRCPTGFNQLVASGATGKSQLPKAVVAWIEQETSDSMSQAKELWRTVRSRYDWPSAEHCCT